MPVTVRLLFDVNGKAVGSGQTPPREMAGKRFLTLEDIDMPVGATTAAGVPRGAGGVVWLPY